MPLPLFLLYCCCSVNAVFIANGHHGVLHRMLDELRPAGPIFPRTSVFDAKHETVWFVCKTGAWEKVLNLFIGAEQSFSIAPHVRSCRNAQRPRIRAAHDVSTTAVVPTQGVSTTAVVSTQGVSTQGVVGVERELF